MITLVHLKYLKVLLFEFTNIFKYNVLYSKYYNKLLAECKLVCNSIKEIRIPICFCFFIRSEAFDITNPRLKYFKVILLHSWV